MIPTSSLPALLPAPERALGKDSEGSNLLDDTGSSDDFTGMLQQLWQSTDTLPKSALEPGGSMPALAAGATSQLGQLLQGTQAAIGDGGLNAEVMAWLRGLEGLKGLEGLEAIDGLQSDAHWIDGLRESEPELAGLLDELLTFLTDDGGADIDAWLVSAQDFLADSHSVPNDLSSEDLKAMSPAETLTAFLAQLPPELLETLQAQTASGKPLPRAVQTAAGLDLNDGAMAQFDESIKSASARSQAQPAVIKPQAMAIEGLPPSTVADAPSAQQELRRMISNMVESAQAGNEAPGRTLDTESLRQSWSHPTGASGASLIGLSGALPPAVATAPTTGSAGAPLLPTIPVPPGDSAWGKVLGERIMWMVGKDMQSAELRLTPPQLGPVDIRVSVQNDQASVSFTAAHPLAREALEAALPRLRDMLAESNLQLADANVSEHNNDRSKRGQGEGGAAGSQSVADDWEDGGEQVAAHGDLPARGSGAGLVDYFA